MFLNKIHLVNFKNYEDAELSFEAGVNCFTGDNGSGKTNLLDAIHYLSLCKSAFNSIDSQNIRHGKEMFVIQGNFINGDQQDTVYCGFRKGEKKQFKLNQKEYHRLADHIGLFPSVMISPEDSVLISGGSEERRKLLDSIIAQYDRPYLDLLITYNRILLQRNALLKHFAENRFDKQALQVWDDQLAEAGEHIYLKRTDFAKEFSSMFNKYFNILSDKKETAGLIYSSQLKEKKLTELLESSIEKDRVLQYTSSGIHKDDLLFTLNEYPVKKFGSQGQLKSFLSALKLAQFEFLHKIKKVKPILLLDDIFDKLDDHRVNRLMELVSTEAFGQLFITDTHPERVAEIFKRIHVHPKVFVVKNGEISVSK